MDTFNPPFSFLIALIFLPLILLPAGYRGFLDFAVSQELHKVSADGKHLYSREIAVQKPTMMLDFHITVH